MSLQKKKNKKKFMKLYQQKKKYFKKYMRLVYFIGMLHTMITFKRVIDKSEKYISNFLFIYLFIFIFYNLIFDDEAFEPYKCIC